MKYSKIIHYHFAVKFSLPLILLFLFLNMLIMNASYEEALSLINASSVFLCIYYAIIVPFIIFQDSFQKYSAEYGVKTLGVLIFTLIVFGKAAYSIFAFFSNEIPKGIEILTLQNIIVSSLVSTVIVAIEIKLLNKFIYKK